MMCESLPMHLGAPAIMPEMYLCVQHWVSVVPASAAAACPAAALQEASKHSGDELPDFYNIVLERPRDDPKGYDVLFFDAAQKLSSEALLSDQMRICIQD